MRKQSRAGRKTKRVAHLIAVFLPETDDGSLAAPSSRSPMAEVGAGFGTAEVMGRVVGGLHRRRSLGFCRRPLFFGRVPGRCVRASSARVRSPLGDRTAEQ